MHRLLLIAPLALLAACSDAPDGAAPEASATPTSAPTTTTPPFAAPHAAPDPRASASADLSIAAMNLSPGVYAQAGSSCPPASASLATFDGQGFGSRNAAQCTFVPDARTRATWRGTQTCTDPASQDRVSEDLAITVASATRFTRTDQWGTATFDLCPDEDLADWTG